MVRSRVQWRSSITGHGALSVMNTGVSSMLALCAECWDIVMPLLLINGKICMYKKLTSSI